MRLAIMLVLLIPLTGCAGAFPEPPKVTWYDNPKPLMIQQEPVQRPGQLRAIAPPPIAAPVCLTDLDHIKLDAYLDAIEDWRKRARY